MVIYVVMHYGAWLYVYFYITGVAIHHSPSTTLVLYHMRLYTWLYIMVCSNGTSKTAKITLLR